MGRPKRKVIAVFVDRIQKRAEIGINKTDEKRHISVFEVVAEIAEEVINSYRQLINDITLKKTPQSALESIIIKMINRQNYRVSGKTRDELVQEILNSLFGYGLVHKYMEMPDVNGIFINDVDNVWIQAGNKRKRVDESFGSEANLILYIKTIQAKLGGEINENKPICKFSDPLNRLRIICGIPPVAIKPFVAFRKHPDKGYSVDDLISLGMLNEELANDLRDYISAGANIVFCGRGGAGKTTLMGALINLAAADTRILMMQEQDEIIVEHPNILSTIVKRNELGNVTGLRELTDYGLLMSVERYAFGEIRSGEAFPLFKGAMSGNITYTTTHSVSARDVVDMLMLNMKFSGTDLGSEALKEILYKSIDIIVFLDSFVVTEVVEVISENKQPADKFNDIWNFDISHRQSTFIKGSHKKVGPIKGKDMLNKLMFSKKQKIHKLKKEEKDA